MCVCLFVCVYSLFLLLYRPYTWGTLSRMWKNGKTFVFFPLFENCAALFRTEEEENETYFFFPFRKRPTGRVRHQI